MVTTTHVHTVCFNGGGTNIFRGHDNVQGATDLGVLSHTLPGYYGLSAGAWAHWSRVWNEDLDWLKGQFATVKNADGKDKNLMNLTGIPVSRWIDGILEDPARCVRWFFGVMLQTRKHV